MALIELAKVVFCLQLLWFASIDCKHDHPIPTYFGRVHPNGTIVDARNPENRLKLNFPPKPTCLDPGAVLKVSPSSNIDNGAEVTVMWSGVSSPSAKDVVILYCPPDAEPDHYLDFIYVSSISSYTKGYGEFAVRLWNLRKECQFGYYRNDNYTLVVAKSEVLTFKGGAEIPLQGHLALTGNPTEMRVMWVSGSSKFIPPWDILESPLSLFPCQKNRWLCTHCSLHNTHFMSPVRRMWHFARSVNFSPPLTSLFALVSHFAQNAAFASRGS